MKKFIILFFCILSFSSYSQDDYAQFFTQQRLRYDYMLGGNNQTVTVYPVEIKKEKEWAGPTKNLISPFEFGTYRYQAFDRKSNKLIYSKGFNTLFQEWQSTAEAKNSNRLFYQAAILPFPKNDIILHVDARQRDGNFKTVHIDTIQVDDYFIRVELPKEYETKNILKNGNAHNKVDIVILAEGYNPEEQQKFWNDSRRMCDALFNIEPYKTERINFNVTAVFTSSLESGTDIPGMNIYKNTTFNSSFYTFNIARYLTTTDMKVIYDVAAGYNYDQLYVMVNTKKYGGGGFYNLLSLCAADGRNAEEVFIHEFGHAFVGLADEYYTSDVAYEDFYNLSVEPWEANLTTLKHFDKKWKDLIDSNIPIPTPREKKYYDVVGAFEGGGYTSKGIYSPQMDCRMKSNTTEKFCPVCTRTIKRMIEFYSNQNINNR